MTCRPALLRVGLLALPSASAGLSMPVTWLSAQGLAAPATDWPSYGFDPAETRFSPLAQITPANAPRLGRAWRTPIGAGAGPQEGAQYVAMLTPGPPTVQTFKLDGEPVVFPEVTAP